LHKSISLHTWKRHNQFQFFKEFDNPFFNICADVDVTRLLAFKARHDASFSIAALFLATRAANHIEAFRYRIRGDKVIVHDVIHAGSTILLPDETFGFCYFHFSENFHTFHQAAEVALREFKKAENKFDPHDERDDLIHYSIIPWVSFSAFAHAKRFRREDSIPKIVFGKYHETGGAMKMPVSVEVHHALADGLHVGKFYSLFQEYLDAPENHLAHEV